MADEPEAPKDPEPELPKGMKQRLNDLLYGLQGDVNAYRRSIDCCNETILDPLESYKHATEEAERKVYEGSFRLLKERALELEGLMREAGLEIDN